MTEERRIKTALQAEASKMRLPPDLLDRINEQADRIPAVRPSLWSRWRLGPKVELAAACLLLIGLIGLTGLRHPQQNPAPAPVDPGQPLSGRQAAVPNCCPEPDFTPSVVVTRFRAAGVDAKLGDQNLTRLFGATQVQSIIADGENVVVYMFATAADAYRALAAMKDPLANTVSWVGAPQFFPMGNLVIQIDFSHAAAAQKLKAALFND